MGRSEVAAGRGGVIIMTNIKLTPMPRNEIFYAIFGIRLGKLFFGKIQDFNEGDVSSVEFDYYAIKKSIDNGKNLIGFYHTHPHDAFLSPIDYSTMDNWVTSEGKSLLCFIEGNNGRLLWKCYNDDEYYCSCDRTEVVSFNIGKYIFGWMK